MESLRRRRDRKHRNQRIRAGVLGLAIAIAVGWLGVNAIRSTQPVPADDPTPTEGLGIFAPVAGRIVYGNEARPTSATTWPVGGRPERRHPTRRRGAERRQRCRLDLLGLARRRSRSAGRATAPSCCSSEGRRRALFPEEYLYILHADGSETQLNSEPMYFAEHSATISPDGERVVFAAQGDHVGLYVVDAEGGRPAPLPIPSSTGAWARRPSRPTGRRSPTSPGTARPRCGSRTRTAPTRTRSWRTSQPCSAAFRPAVVAGGRPPRDRGGRQQRERRPCDLHLRPRRLGLHAGDHRWDLAVLVARRIPDRVHDPVRGAPHVPRARKGPSDAHSSTLSREGVRRPRDRRRGWLQCPGVRLRGLRALASGRMMAHWEPTPHGELAV